MGVKSSQNLSHKYIIKDDIFLNLIYLNNIIKMGTFSKIPHFLIFEMARCIPDVVITISCLSKGIKAKLKDIDHWKSLIEDIF